MVTESSPSISRDILIEEVVLVTDILIRDVPADVVAALDAQAGRLGLSRTEYLKRQLTHAAEPSVPPVAHKDLEWFAEAFTDLSDPEVMASAWR